MPDILIVRAELADHEAAYYLAHVVYRGREIYGMPQFDHAMQVVRTAAAIDDEITADGVVRLSKDERLALRLAAVLFMAADTCGLTHDFLKFQFGATVADWVESLAVRSDAGPVPDAAEQIRVQAEHARRMHKLEFGAALVELANLSVLAGYFVGFDRSPLDERQLETFHRNARHLKDRLEGVVVSLRRSTGVYLGARLQKRVEQIEALA